MTDTRERQSIQFVAPAGPPEEFAYESEYARVWHGTAEGLLDSGALGRDSVDLLATDPPYGVAYVSNMREESFGAIANDEGEYDPRPVFETIMKHHLRDYRHFYVFGPFTFEGLPVGATAELIWDKGVFGMGDLSQPWGPQHEPVTFGVVSRSNVRVKRGGLTARMRKGSVLRVQRPMGRAVKRHPTEKPVELMRLLVESSSVVGDVVLDPYAGSGSTAVAAILLGRRAVIAEMDDRYVETAIERIMNAERLYEEALRV